MKILKWLDANFEKVVCVFLMSVLSADLGLQVFMRYVVHASLGWSEELARYTFVWLVYMTISYGSLKMRHIKIDAGLYLFPKKARKYVVIIGDVIFFFFAIAIVYYSWGLEQKQIMFGQLSPAMQIPMWIPYGAPLVGFALTAIRELETIIYRIKHLKEADEDKPLDLENL